MRKKTVVPRTSLEEEQIFRYRLILGLNSPKVRRISKKGLLALVAVSLWYWNWQLLLSVTVGISLMWLTYKISRRQYLRWWQNLITWLSHRNQRLLIAVASGSVAGLFTYMVSAIWIDTENHWLATGSILQGVATFMTLGLLGWQIKDRSRARKSAEFPQLLGDLTADNSLKRLIAIRQLTNLVNRKILDREQRSQIREYFRFMLTQPQEQLVQEALLDSLDILGVVKISSNPPQILETPMKLTKSIRELS